MNWPLALWFIIPLYYSQPLLAEETEGIRWAELDRFSLKLMKFGCNREFQTPELDCYQYKGRVAAEFDLRMLNDYLYWNNEVHGEGTDAKFMTMGWHYELGLDLGKVELFWEHHSRHTLDQEQPYYWDTRMDTWKQMKYPVEDSYGIRINFYKRGDK